MKLCVLVMMIAAAAAQDDRLDSMKVDEVLANRRLLIAYLKCVLGQGRCTPEGNHLKANISEALQNGCNTCTESQRTKIKQVIGHLMNKEQSWWQQLVDKYDPQGTYAAKYEKELKSI